MPGAPNTGDTSFMEIQYSADFSETPSTISVDTGFMHDDTIVDQYQCEFIFTTLCVAGGVGGGGGGGEWGGLRPLNQCSSSPTLTL